MLACCCFHSFFHRLFPATFFFFPFRRKITPSRSLDLFQYTFARALSLSLFLFLNCFCCCCYYDYTNTARAFVVLVSLFLTSHFVRRSPMSDQMTSLFLFYVLCVSESESVCVFKGTVCIFYLTIF